MRLRTLILSISCLFALLPLGCSRTTPTEAAAIVAAKADHTAYVLPPAKLLKAHRIARFYDTMYFAGTAWSILSLWLTLQFGVARRMRVLASRISGRRWLQGIVFVLELLLLLTLLNLPLSIASHHASVGFGFSIQSWPSWAADQAKSLLLTCLLAAPFILLLFFLIRRFPRRWWLWLWFPTVVIVLFGVYLSPILIDPLFNQFEPLARTDPALVQQLEQVARHGGLDIPPSRMFLMRASAKTTLMNAYVTGFGSSKRLVIWDTLLAQAKLDQIAIIAGHEMGHYALGHVMRGTCESFLGILLAFFAGFHLFQIFLRRFGPRWGVTSQQDWAALLLMLLVAHVIAFFAQPISNSLSRGMEHDADVFGQEVVHGIIADPQATGEITEQMLGEAYYAEPNPDPLIEFWTDSHPSSSFRAAFSKHYNPWAPGAHPRFFPY